jgi:flavin-dependent dehydrogenase
MLLGDAAGLVDPLTREGIYYALLSGQWAAEAITQSSERAPALYTDRLMAEIYPELRRAATLSQMFFSTPFSSLLVHALRQSASIREVFADLVAGAQPYQGLLQRLLATGEWTLAARAAQIAFRPRKNPGIGGTITPDTLPTEASPRS